MEDKAAEGRYDASSKSHWNIPRHDLEGGRTHVRGHIESSVKEKNSERAVGEKERRKECGHAWHLE